MNASTTNGKAKETTVAGHLRQGKLRNYLRTCYYAATVAVRTFGVEPRSCNGCGYHGNFMAFGFPPRFDAQCPQCGSLERHRLLKFWFDENQSIVRGANLLHFAPEERIKNYLVDQVGTYRGADILPGLADLVLNIEAIDLPDESVDFIICSHVLEHVNDKLALAEMLRILIPGGAALLLFPIVEGWSNTLTEATLGRTVATPDERRLYFGQNDHVKIFGRDVRDKIRAAGFGLTEFVAEEPRVSKYGLQRGETIFVAKRPL